VTEGSQPQLVRSPVLNDAFASPRRTVPPSSSVGLPTKAGRAIPPASSAGK
jgi:hypothetical protein